MWLEEVLDAENPELCVRQTSNLTPFIHESECLGMRPRQGASFKDRLLVLPTPPPYIHTHYINTYIHTQTYTHRYIHTQDSDAQPGAENHRVLILTQQRQNFPEMERCVSRH